MNTTKRFIGLTGTCKRCEAGITLGDRGWTDSQSRAVCPVVPYGSAFHGHDVVLGTYVLLGASTS